ncbi:MAG TPA: hypothetical protein P5277_00345 [Candidatus Paceibacterota bacterium]|nr:hypothetical protein [Candidatus Paceibacterota bacterium]
MTHLYLVPHWFFIYSIIFEAIFAIASGLISYFSFKVYNLSKQKESKWFGAGFFLISVSYVIWLIINLCLLRDNTQAVGSINLEQIVFWWTFAIYSHLILFVTGVITLICSHFKKNKLKLFALLEVISLVSIYLSCNKGLSFYVISSIFLAYLAIIYFLQYLKKRKFNSFLSMIAFILLFISHVQFILASNNYLYYVFGHIVEFMGYLLLISQLIIILKHG